jgi:demethylmenaquinone methyltransferase/2-methoxy-6-polyprenyl-1,4-benzoquinol methylase
MPASRSAAADKPPGHGAAVRAMFGRIARRYDLMNRLMTCGLDERWRRLVVRQAALPPGGRLLDAGSGTGGIALAARRRHPDALVVAADFSPAMMAVGQRRAGGGTLAWCAADALHLPFRDGSFDAVTSGYLLRNVADLPAALAEQARLLRPGGRVVCLDTSPAAAHPVLSPLVGFHMRRVIPLLGRLVAREAKAYNYLPASTRLFLPPSALAAAMRAAGLRQVGWRRLMLGSVALHWGIRGPAGKAGG